MQMTVASNLFERGTLMANSLPSWFESLWDISPEQQIVHEAEVMINDTLDHSPIFQYILYVFGHLAPWAATILCFAPLPTVQQIIRDGSVGSLPLLPYTSLILSAFFWTAYGLLKGEPKIWSANVIGFGLGIYYFWVYCRFIPAKNITYATLPGSVEQHLKVLGALLGSTLLMIISGWEGRVDALGKISVFFSIAFFYSPLSVMRTVMRTGSAKCIPLPLTLATVINCFLWTVVGWFDMKDANVYVPNTLGLFFGLAQLLLKIMYGNGPPSSSIAPRSGNHESTMELLSA